jgi:hypothetical protein
VQWCIVPVDSTGSGLFKGLCGVQLQADRIPRAKVRKENRKRLMKVSVSQGLERTRLAGAIAHNNAPIEASRLKALPFDDEMT